MTRADLATTAVLKNSRMRALKKNAARNGWTPLSSEFEAPVLPPKIFQIVSLLKVRFLM